MVCARLSGVNWREATMTSEDREAFAEAVEIAVERLRCGNTVERVHAFLRQLDYASVEFVVDTAQREPRRQRQEACNVIQFPTPTT